MNKEEAFNRILNIISNEREIDLNDIMARYKRIQDTIIAYQKTTQSEPNSKGRSYKNIERIKTIQVPIELKLKRKDGSIVTFKAKKIVKDPNLKAKEYQE